MVRKLTEEWLGDLESGCFEVNPLTWKPALRLQLEDGSPPLPSE